MEEIKALKDISNVSQVQLLDMPDRVFRIHQKDEPAIIAGDARPSIKPANPQFSSGTCPPHLPPHFGAETGGLTDGWIGLLPTGPTKKRPGYSIKNLPTDCLGRSHRSKLGKVKNPPHFQPSPHPLSLRLTVSGCCVPRCRPS